jgi:glutaminyl-peptide cyclotransferase
MKPILSLKMEKMEPAGATNKMYRTPTTLIWSFIFLLLIAGCKTDSGTKQQTDIVKPRATVPAVSPDSAFSFIDKQLSFGVRVPGTPGHKATRDWIKVRMEAYGASVELQEFKASFLGKTNVTSWNIIAKINPESTNRVILFAHWDTRLIAEKDKNEPMREKPIQGAVDGASGVAGLLEIARLVFSNPLNDFGVDFVFFDAEDQGNDGAMESWCLGSQYWSASVANQQNKPKYGILLDLIGAKGATYSKEGISTTYAGDLQNKIWDLAAAMGKGNMFINAPIGQITDDHYYVNTIAGIPTVDIIETKPSGYFAAYHHTHDDNIEAIDRENLAAVIQVVTAAIYKMSDNTF